MKLMKNHMSAVVHAARLSITNDFSMIQFVHRDLPLLAKQFRLLFCSVSSFENQTISSLHRVILFAFQLK